MLVEIEITISGKEANMARKAHSLNTKKVVFGKATPTNVKDIRLDRSSRKIQFDKVGNPKHEMGLNIHHIDGNPKNDSISNYEAINYITHSEVHDED